MLGEWADAGETAQALVQGDSASIGPGQMQPARAKALENLGYATKRANNEDRINALLSGHGTIEYIAAELQFNRDQLLTIKGYSQLDVESQSRILMLSYNQGIINLTPQIYKLGFKVLIEEAKYDSQTYDEFMRWKQEHGQ